MFKEEWWSWGRQARPQNPCSLPPLGENHLPQEAVSVVGHNSCFTEVPIETLRGIVVLLRWGGSFGAQKTHVVIARVEGFVFFL